jgi:hypothetical protein
VGFVVDKVVLGQVFFSEYFGFALSISFHWCSITRLHNKPQGCGMSAASAAGPFTTKKNTGVLNTQHALSKIVSYL